MNDLENKRIQAEDEKLIDKFASRWTPKKHVQRLRAKKVDRKTEEAIKKAFDIE